MIIPRIHHSTFYALVILVMTVYSSCHDPEVGDDFTNRLSSREIAEDPLVIEYLKQLQDTSDLVPSVQGENIAQTFNNSIVAIAFILSNEKQRAERILDFYANATDQNNMDKGRQNFFYNNKARGFYQSCSITTLRDDSGTADRWMGDMAWLLLAFKFYEMEYNSTRYAAVTKLLRNLLSSFYVSSGTEGYVQSGWRDGDAVLHEPNGHHEGNIDAYAALRMAGVGADTLSGIKSWIERELTTDRNNQDLPLDLYGWRTLAFGSDYAYLLTIPENDTRYRKTLTFNSKRIIGFYSSPNALVNNIWIDGTAHIACAYFSYGDASKGKFYSNRLSDMLITNVIGNTSTKTLPYAANTSGDYGWVNPTKGFASCAAWYIIVKHKLNPMGTDNFQHD